MTKSDVKFVWDPACLELFDYLKKALCTAPVLKFPPLLLDTDANQYAIGAVLRHIIDGKEQVLCYASRMLSKMDRNYYVTRRELLSVIYFVEQLRHYLYGRKFTIWTDHAFLH